MASQIDNCLIQTRSYLQSQGVKLWLTPYYEEGIGPIESELEALAVQLCELMHMSKDYVLAAINELQTNALEKLKARDMFRDTGVATIKVRIPATKNGGRLLTVESRIDVLADQLYGVVADKLNLPTNKIKLISSGRVISPFQVLKDQGVQNNQQIMAIIRDTDEAEAAKEEQVFDKLQSTRNDAAALLENDDDFLDMEDQDGNLIHLPPAEKKAIMMALAIHEKGRAALKRNDYNEALLFLLEADSDYKMSNSQLLQSVDNIPRLNLDIVWCYVMLKSIGQLPDAENRLRVCEDYFKRSYGPNLDRVMSLKGNSANERALIMRLHLLQGILQYHQNLRNEASSSFSTAETEWRQLQVSENLVVTLMEMGYTNIEARTGLRSCSNSIDQTISFIADRREQLKMARQKARAERRTKHAISKTKDDKWVNPRTLHTLCEMGFDKDISAIALQKTDNNLEQAMSLIQTSSDSLREEFETTKVFTRDSALIEQLVSMGFDENVAALQLKAAMNDIQKAIENLTKSQASGVYESLVQAANMVSNVAGPSTQAAAEAYDRFAEDLQNDDDEYLDLPLTDERTLLDEYKKMLGF